MIDITSCREAIDALKRKIDNCFALCDAKGSTYTQSANTTSELYYKINAIPVGEGDGSEGGSIIIGTGQPFSGFTVSSSNDQQLTINCGSVGTGWKGIAIYSNSKRGYFTIHKVDSSRCIVCGMPWYYYDDGSTTGAFPYSLESTSAMCNYTVSGSTITLNVIVYSVENPADISMLGNQINTESNYMLDLIDIY